MNPRDAMAPGATDYAMPNELAEMLSGIALMPADQRAVALEIVAGRIGGKAFIRLFAEFIGMANSVVDNNRDMIELFLVTDAGMHPHTAEKIHLPTIRAALEGILLADGIDASKICAGCAFRLGTPANQSPISTLDADHCSEPSERPFYCHADVDDRGEPLHACHGWAQKRMHRREAMGPQGAAP